MWYITEKPPAAFVHKYWRSIAPVAQLAWTSVGRYNVASACGLPSDVIRGPKQGHGKSSHLLPLDIEIRHFSGRIHAVLPDQPAEKSLCASGSLQQTASQVCSYPGRGGLGIAW